MAKDRKKDKRFAPPYEHKKALKGMAVGFTKIFVKTVDDVVDHVADEAIKLGIGSANTLHGNGPKDQIRFDRQRCRSGRHPKDNFVN